MRPIIVVSNHGQFNHLILRMLRDNDIDAEMVSNARPSSEWRDRCRGVILGGGPSLSRTGHAPSYLKLGVPVLGICLGMHIIAHELGGEVTTGQKGGYGAVDVVITDHDTILKGYQERIRVWASHADEVAAVPPGFSILAHSGICGIEAMAEPQEGIFGIQWHPEVSHTEQGELIFRNFDQICR
ncbi:MAG: GMP synthase subunit A [Methanoculleaceae archaeon]